MAKTVAQILNGYFNVGEGRVGTTEFLTELKALSLDEKKSLASGVCEITGDTIK